MKRIMLISVLAGAFIFAAFPAGSIAGDIHCKPFQSNDRRCHLH